MGPKHGRFRLNSRQCFSALKCFPEEDTQFLVSRPPRQVKRITLEKPGGPFKTFRICMGLWLFTVKPIKPEIDLFMRHASNFFTQGSSTIMLLVNH